MTSSCGRRRFAPLILYVLAPLVSGCTGMIPGGAGAPLQTFILEARLQPAPAGARGDRVLLVEPARAEPGAHTRYIAYSRSPQHLDYYIQSQWADTPARMLQPLLVASLDASGLYRAVLASSAGASADLRLEVDIIELRQRFWDTPSEVRFVLRARLYDVEQRTVLGTRTFEALQPAPSEDAAGGVAAANHAVAQVLADLVSFLREF